MQTTLETKPHIRWRHFGPRQGAQCECGDMFYPDGQKIIDIQRAHRIHHFEKTGMWPEEVGA